MKPYGCEAIQEGDQLTCHKCGLYWQINDHNPPRCRTKQEIQQERNRRGIAEMKRILSNADKKSQPTH